MGALKPVWGAFAAYIPLALATCLIGAHTLLAPLSYLPVLAVGPIVAAHKPDRITAEQAAPLAAGAIGVCLAMIGVTLTLTHGDTGLARILTIGGCALTACAGLDAARHHRNQARPAR